MPNRPPDVVREAALAALVALGLLAAGCSATEGSEPVGTATLAPPVSTSAAPTTPAPASTAATTVLPATSPPATSPPPPTTCPVWSEPTTTGRLPATLPETSGLAAGRRNPDVLWAHNDSGNAASLFAVDETGALLAEVPLQATALDWEDLAVGPGPDGQPWLWVADTGDNLRLRGRVTLYRLPEPAVDPATPGATLPATGVEAITVTYPDGPHDVETLLVDPVTGDAFLVGKTADGAIVPVYRLAADRLQAGTTVEAEQVASITGRIDQGNGPTAGDVSADGTLVLVSNGGEGFLWLRDPAEPLATLFSRQPSAPCAVDPGGGEAVAFSVDGTHLWAANEGDGAALRRFDRA